MTSNDATQVLAQLYALGERPGGEQGTLDELMNQVRDGERRCRTDPISRALTLAYRLLGAEPDTGPYCDMGRSWLNGEHPIQKVSNGRVEKATHRDSEQV